MDTSTDFDSDYYNIWIENNVLLSADETEVFHSSTSFCELLRKYKSNPDVIQFLADMLEVSN